MVSVLTLVGPGGGGVGGLLGGVVAGLVQDVVEVEDEHHHQPLLVLHRQHVDAALEVGAWGRKQEAGSRKQEAGSRKQETGNRNEGLMRRAFSLDC